jgi:hypothetical protein
MVGAEAQGIAQELRYAPLPASVAGLVSARIGTLTANGAAIPGE